VFVAGARGTFDSTECALRTADGEASPARNRPYDDEQPRANDMREPVSRP
jgi:hypothetical protein